MRTDEELFLDLSNGDMAAFDELYRRYERRLFGYILCKLGDYSEAEDVFHEAFMAVLEKRCNDLRLMSFRAWIFKVAHNFCGNRLRSRVRGDRALRIEGGMSEPSVDAEQLLCLKEIPAALGRAVESLPKPLAEVYRLRASGFSYEEIAVALEVPIGTVKSRMHGMIDCLRKEMELWIAT